MTPNNWQCTTWCNKRYANSYPTVQLSPLSSNIGLLGPKDLKKSLDLLIVEVSAVTQQMKSLVDLVSGVKHIEYLYREG